MLSDQNWIYTDKCSYFLRKFQTKAKKERKIVRTWKRQKSTASSSSSYLYLSMFNKCLPHKFFVVFYLLVINFMAVCRHNMYINYCAFSTKHARRLFLNNYPKKHSLNHDGGTKKNAHSPIEQTKISSSICHWLYFSTFDRFILSLYIYLYTHIIYTPRLYEYQREKKNEIGKYSLGSRFSH